MTVLTQNKCVVSNTSRCDICTLSDGLTGRTLREYSGDVGEPVEGHPRHSELATLGQRGQRVQLLQVVEVGGAADEARLVRAGLWVRSEGTAPSRMKLCQVS